MAREEGRYLVVRDNHMLSFTLKTPLAEEHYYCGYFSYPDMRLYSVEEKDPWSMAYMDLGCANKESGACYDSIEISDLLNEYEIYSN